MFLFFALSPKSIYSCMYCVSCIGGITYMQFLFNNRIYDSAHSCKIAVHRKKDYFAILYRTQSKHWFIYTSEYIARDYVISEFNAISPRQALMRLAQWGRYEKIKVYFPDCIYEK